MLGKPVSAGRIARDRRRARSGLTFLWRMGFHDIATRLSDGELSAIAKVV